MTENNYPMLDNQSSGMADRSLDIQQATPAMNRWALPEVNLPQYQPVQAPKTFSDTEVPKTDSLEALVNSIESGGTPSLRESSLISRRDIPKEAEKFPTYTPGLSIDENEDIAYQQQGTGERLGNIINNTAVRFSKTLAQSTVGVITGTLLQLDPSNKGYNFYNNPVSKKLNEFGEEYEKPVFESKARKDASWYSPTYWWSGNTVNNVMGMLGDLAAFYVTGKLVAAPIAAIAGRATSAAVGLESTLGEEALASIERIAVPEYTEAVTKFGRVVGAMEEGEARQVGLELEKSMKAIQESTLTDAEKLSKSTKLISDLSAEYASKIKVVNAVQQGVASTITNLGMAQSSGFDAYNSFKTKMVQDIYNQGRTPTDDELADINEMANTVGRTTAIVMGAMGAITLHGIAKGIFAKGEAQDLVSLQTEKIVKKEAEKLALVEGEKVAEKEVEKTAIKTADKYQVDKWKPTATTKVGKVKEKALHVLQTAPGYVQSYADLWPGIGMVEFSLAPRTIEEYYEKKYKEPNSDWATNLAGSLGNNVKNIFTKEGITDFFLGVVGGIPFEAGRKFQERKEIAENTRAALKGMNAGKLNDVIKAINYSYENGSLKTNINTSIRGLALRDEYIDAIKVGDEEKAKTLKQQQLENWLYPFIKYGQKRFADSEIQTMRDRANSDEGIRELQREKMIPEGDNIEELRKNYLKSMDDIQTYVNNAEKYYKALKLKYGNSLKDEHIEKLMVLSGGIDDASKRVKQLTEEISNTPIGTDVEFMKAYKDLIDYYAKQGDRYNKENISEVIKLVKTNEGIFPDFRQFTELVVDYEGTEKGVEDAEDSAENIKIRKENIENQINELEKDYQDRVKDFVNNGLSEKEAKKKAKSIQDKFRETEKRKSLEELKDELENIDKEAKKKRPVYKIGRLSDEVTRAVLKKIDTMKGDLNPDQKMDLAKKVADTFKLQILKKRYMSEYEDIIRNPELHVDTTKEGITSPSATAQDEDKIDPSDVTLKVANKENEKRFKRGNIYHAAEEVSPGKGSKAGKAGWRNFRSFYIPEDGDPILSEMNAIETDEKGNKQIFIVDTKTKKGQYVPESAFKNVKFVSDKDLSKKENENMKFFIDNLDTPFRMKYWRREDGKNTYEWVEGKLTKFDPEEPDEFLFTPDDRKSFKPRNVSKDDFKRKGKFGANIESLKPLSQKSEEWINSALSERDKKAAQRMAERNLNTLIEHIDEREKTLKKLYDDIQDNKLNIEIYKEELEKIQKETAKIKKEPWMQKPWAERNKEEREYYRKHFKTVLDAGKSLTKIIKGLEDTNVSLEAQAQEIEREIVWLDGIDPTSFPEGKVDILNFIDDNRANLMIAQEETMKGIKSLKDLIKTARKALDGFINNIRSRREMFSKKYLGGAPFSDNAMQLFLKREVDERRELGSMSEGSISDILPEVTKEFEDIRKAITQAIDFDIPMRETEIEKNVKDLADLEQKMKNLNEELKFQTNLFDTFKKAWEEYEKEDAKREELSSDEYLNKIIKLQGAMDLESVDDEPAGAEKKRKETKQFWEPAAPLLGRESEDKSTVFPDEVADKVGAEGDQDAQLGKWVKRYNKYMKNRGLRFPVPENRDPNASYIGEFPEAEERVIVISYNNQDQYFGKRKDGEKFISKSYEYAGKTIDNKKDFENGTIRYVHVARKNIEGDTDFYFIDQDGKFLSKVDEAEAINFKDLVFSNRATYNPYEFRLGKNGEPLTDASGRKVKRYIVPKGASEKDINAVHAVSKELRKSLLQSKDKSSFYSFTEARGTKREQREPSVGGKKGKVKVTSRSVGKAALILDTPESTITLKGSLQLPTLRVGDSNAGNVQVGDYVVKFPIGQGVLVNNGNAMIVDNNRFDSAQVDHLYKVISAMAQDYLDTGKINRTYVKYLSRVLHFSSRIPEEGISKNQLYFDKKGNLAFAREKLQEVKNEKGETDIQIVEDEPLLITFFPSDIKAYEKEIKGWLSEAFHNISSAGLKEDGFTEITDIKYENGKPVPVTREWTSYEDYLMSDYIRLKDDVLEGKAPQARPEGKRPLTVNVSNAEDWQGPFANKYIVPKFNEAEYPEIKVRERKETKRVKGEAGDEAQATVPTLERKGDKVSSITATDKQGKESTYFIDGRENTTDNVIPLIFKATVKDDNISVEMIGIDEEKFEENISKIKDEEKKNKILLTKDKMNLDEMGKALEKKLNSFYKQALTAELEEDFDEDLADNTEKKTSIKTSEGLSLNTTMGKVFIDGKENPLTNAKGEIYGSFTAKYNSKTGIVEVKIKSDTVPEKTKQIVKSKYETALTKYYNEQITEVEDTEEVQEETPKTKIGKAAAKVDVPWTDEDTFTQTEETQSKKGSKDLDQIAQEEGFPNAAIMDAQYEVDKWERKLMESGMDDDGGDNLNLENMTPEERKEYYSTSKIEEKLKSAKADLQKAINDFESQQKSSIEKEPVKQASSSTSEAKRADIERRREEEINKLDIYGDQIRSFQEISKFGDTLSSALDNIAQKQKQLSNELNRKQKEDTKDRSIHQYTKEELEANPEYQEIKRLDKLVDTINRSVGKPENFEETVESHINYWVEQKKKAEASRSDKSKIGRINLKYDALGKKEADEKEPVKEPVKEPTTKKSIGNFLKNAKNKAKTEEGQEGPDVLRPMFDDERITKIDDPEEVSKFFAETLPGIDFKNVPHAIKSGDVYAWGRYVNHYVELVVGAPYGTGYHEAFHAVWDSYLTDIEQADILNELRSRQGTFELYGQTYNYADASYDTLMERMAEEFRMYKEQHPEYTKPSKLTNFFSRLWNFLQHLFGKPVTLNEVFKKMNNSWYRDARFVREPEDKARLSEMKNVTKPELKYILENTSERIIDALRKSNGGLISVAQGTIIADMLKPGFEWMKDYYENNDESSSTYKNSIWGRAERQVQYIMNSKSYTEKQKEAMINNIESEIEGALTLWEKMKNEEGNDFSNDLKKDLEKYLKRLKLKFIKSKSAIAKKRLEMRKKEDSAEVAQSELFDYQMGEENRDRTYDRKELQIDLSRNAPDEIKLLFSFLTKPDPKAENPNRNAESGDPLFEVNSKLSPLLLPELLQGTKWMYMTLDRLSGITNPALMRQAMWELAKENPELVKVYNSVYKEPKTREDFMMRISFKKFMSKIKPLYTRWIKPEGEKRTFIAESEGATKLMLTQWESSLRGGTSIVDSSGRYSINTSKLTTPVAAKRGMEANEERTVMQFLSDINFPVKSDLFRRLGNDRGAFVKAVIDFHSELTKSKREPIRFISVDEFDSGALRQMAKIITKIDPESVVTQHNRPDSNTIQNHIQFNGIAREINKIIEAGSLAELERRQPLLFSDTWCSSLSKTWLKKGGPLFDEKGFIREDVKKGQVLRFTVMEGLANPDNDYNPSIVTTEMSEPVRFMHNLIHNLTGISGMVDNVGIFNNFIPSDKSLEGAIVMPHFITWKSFRDNNRGATTSFKNTIIDFLKDEINLIKENVAGTRLKTKASTAKAEGKRENGKRLQTFKTLLPENLVKRIEDYANKEGKDAEMDTDTFLSDKQLVKEITDAVMEKMDQKAEAEFKKIKDAGLLKYLPKKDEYNFLLMDKKFFGDKKSLSKDEITDILLFRGMNLFVHNTLMRKMFHGPWYEVLDPEKRDAGDYTCTELTYTGDEEFNKYMNTQDQKIGNVKITQGDSAYHNYSDDLSFFIFDHDKGVVSKYINELRKELGDNAKAHESIEEADGQSIMNFKHWKEYVIRSGDKWTEDHQRQHEYDLARHTLADAERRGLKLRPELKKACEDIVDKGNPHFEVGTPRKPLGAGFIKTVGGKAANERVKFFIKTSTYRLSYDIAKDRGLEDLYWFINDNKIGLTGPPSMLKVGNVTDIPELYRVNDKGKVEFALNRAEKAPDKIMGVSYSDFSKILETEHDGMGTSKSSQANSIIVNGSFSNGLPNDFFNKDTDNLQEKREQWLSMTPKEREKASPLYKLVEENTKAINGLLNHGTNLVSRKLGVKRVNGKLKFTNPEKVVEFIRNKAMMGDLTDNIAEAIDWVEDPKTGTPKLKYPIESVPGFQSVRKLLWSIVDRSLVRMKMNGDSYINVSSALWEKQGREAVIKQGDKWVTVTPEMYKKMSTEDRKKIVPTSSELKTYKKGETLPDGSIAETSKCEIYIPNYFLTQLMGWAEATGKSVPDEHALYKHLNSHEGAKLLTSIGIRIPVQGHNSLESMIVKPFNDGIGPDGKFDRKKFKLFLPGEMGSSIVLPSEIVSKSGTDFDVDKTNCYHYNFYVNSKGFPILVKFYEGEDLQDISVLKDIYEQKYSKKQRDAAASSVLIENIFGEMAMDTDTAPTFEQFVKEVQSDPDPYKVNSFEAIQNKYFDTMHSLLLHPDNYKQLMLPNSSEELKSIGKHIDELEGQDVKKDKNEVDYSRMLDASYISESRQRYLDAKGRIIGIAAQNNTYHALATTQFIPINMYLGDEAKIWLPHKQVEIDGVPVTTISSAYNKKGNWISDFISQVINGGVDAVKDDFLIRLVGNKDLVAPSLFLGRVGVDPEYIFTFLRQPIVQQFMKQVTNYNSLRGITNMGTHSKKSLREEVAKNLRMKTMVDPKLDSGPTNMTENFKLEDLEDMISATAKAKGDLTALSPKHRKMQRQVLQEFIHYLEMSDFMLSEQMAIKWDNIRGFTDMEIMSKNISYQNAKEANVIGTVEPIIENTFQGGYKDAINESMEMLSTVMTISSNPEIRSILESIAGTRINSEKKQQAMLTVLYSYIDYATHNYAKVNGMKLNENIYEVMLGKNNAADLWSKFRKTSKGDIDDVMKNVLNNLRSVRKFSSKEVKNINLGKKPPSSIEKDIFTSALETIKNNPHNMMTALDAKTPEEQKTRKVNLYQRLVLSGLLQTGVRTSGRNAWTDMIPNTDYLRIIKQGIDAILSGSVRNFNEIGALYRGNWSNDSFVPTARKIKDKDTDFYEYPYKSIKSESGLLESTAKSENLKVPKFLEYYASQKESRNRYIKTFEKGPNGAIVRLYERVNTLDGKPWISKEQLKKDANYRKVLFKQVNAWGDGRNATEYYDEVRPSVLPIHEKVYELTDSQVIDLAENKGFIEADSNYRIEEEDFDEGFLVKDEKKPSYKEVREYSAKKEKDAKKGVTTEEGKKLDLTPLNKFAKLKEDKNKGKKPKCR